MIIRQISVFLENKAGQLASLIKLLADNKIDLKALSISETEEYGILRIIVDKTDETAEILKKENRMYKINHVLEVTVPDEPGSLLKILSVLAENNISLDYSYAFFAREKGNACIVLRVDQNEKAIKILESSGVLA